MHVCTSLLRAATCLELHFLDAALITHVLQMETLLRSSSPAFAVRSIIPFRLSGGQMGRSYSMSSAGVTDRALGLVTTEVCFKEIGR